MFKLLLFIIINCSLINCLTKYEDNNNNKLVSCKDENNKSVDWFYLYKLPNSFYTKQKNKGLEFLYITENSETIEWKLSDRLINDEESIAGYTVTQSFLTDNNTDRLVIAYNDDPPNEITDGKKGHTKGLLVADKNTGFWLIHSVPNYPAITDNVNDYNYPNTSRKYGQSFLCITFNSEQINLVGKQLLYNEPHIYFTKITNELRELYPNIEKVIKNEKIKNPPYSNEELLLSKNGIEFKSFAKTRKYGKELYEDFVAPSLKLNLYVESWIHGPGVLKSNCTKENSVWNISELKMNMINLTFPTTRDHSKWCISVENNTINSDWICVGDINRAEHQKQRGGGTVCQQSSKIYNIYRSIIADYEPCSKPEQLTIFQKFKKYINRIFS